MTEAENARQQAHEALDKYIDARDVDLTHGTAYADLHNARLKARKLRKKAEKEQGE